MLAVIAASISATPATVVTVVTVTLGSFALTLLTSSLVRTAAVPVSLASAVAAAVFLLHLARKTRKNADKESFMMKIVVMGLDFDYRRAGVAFI